MLSFVEMPQANHNPNEAGDSPEFPASCVQRFQHRVTQSVLRCFSFYFLVFLYSCSSGQNGHYANHMRPKCATDAYLMCYHMRIWCTPVAKRHARVCAPYTSISLHQGVRLVVSRWACVFRTSAGVGKMAPPQNVQLHVCQRRILHSAVPWTPMPNTHTPMP